MAWTRCGAWVACLSLAACFGGGEAKAPGPVGAAAVEATGKPAPDPAQTPISRAILTDELLAAAGPVATPTEAPAPVRILADAEPLPPEIAAVLSGGAPGDRLDPLGDLAISFGTTRRESFETALDSASVLDDGLGDAPVPASPVPDLR